MVLMTGATVSELGSQISTVAYPRLILSVTSIVSGAYVGATPDEPQGRVQAAAISLAMSLEWLGPLAIGIAGAAGPTATVLMTLGWVLGLALVTMFARSLRDGPLAPAAVTATPSAGA